MLRQSITCHSSAFGRTPSPNFHILVRIQSFRKASLHPVNLQVPSLFSLGSQGWRCRSYSPQAVFELSDAVAAVENVASLATGVGILATLSWSAIPIIATPKEITAPDRSVNEEDDEGVKWGLMSVISFLPLFNWLAWIFAGFEDEERASFYYTLAALYAIPQISAGFQPNWFSIATLAAGIAHVQVERIADERGVAQKFAFQLQNDLGDKPAQASKMIGNSARSFADAIQSGANERSAKAGVDEDEADGSAEELEKWDQRFQSGSDKRKRR